MVLSCFQFSTAGCNPLSTSSSTLGSWYREAGVNELASLPVAASFPTQFLQLNERIQPEPASVDRGLLAAAGWGSWMGVLLLKTQASRRTFQGLLDLRADSHTDSLLR